jgi:L-fuculose-phosphate aldolase
MLPTGTTRASGVAAAPATAAGEAAAAFLSLRLASYAPSRPTEAAIIDSIAGTAGESAASDSAGRGGAGREDVVAAGARMLALGLSRGTSGNISVRIGDGMLITPSAIPWHELRPEQLVGLTLGGERLDQARLDSETPGPGPRDAVSGGAPPPPPSSEWRLHAAILRARPDVGAVVHAHPPFATALSCLRRPIPPFHYMIAAAGGDDIPCVPYATFGTEALARHTADALRQRDACLLANHGIVAIGRDLAAALWLAGEVETLAEQYCHARQVGEPVLLTAAEMTEALEAFATYRPGRR